MINYNSNEEKLVCSFTGKLGGAECLLWKEELILKVRQAESAVIFDMKDVDYVASSFLRICIHVPKAIGSENFSLVNVTPSVKKVFKLSGFDKLLNIS